MKTAIVSHVLPPSWSGQAVVLYRLLRDLRPDSYCVISREDYDAADNPAASAHTASARLRTRYHHLAPAPRLELTRLPWQLPWLARLPGSGLAQGGVNAVLTTLHRASVIRRIVRREKCRTVVACTGDLFDLPAAYLAARRERLPFYAYVFDYYSRQWVTPESILVARSLEPIILKGAAGVIVPNEFLCEEYRRRYRINPVVVHNPIEPAADGGRPEPPWPAEPGQVKVVYTGAVYDAHFDAFRNLIAALRELNQPGLRLHLYTAQPREHLDREGISGPVELWPHKPLAECHEVQRAADVLFLPLAFVSPYPAGVIATSAPGKLGEYLAAGRPILAHAPADSFVCWYLNKHECGVVVDRPEPARLAEALRRIMADAELRQRLGRNARARAATDFGLDAARAAFLNVLNGRN